MSSLALYRDLAPAHASISDDTVEQYLELAAQAHDTAAWGAVYAQAMVYYAAHLYESIATDAPGPVKSQRDGDLSRSFAVADDVDEISSTRYGRAYLRLRRSRAATKPFRVTV